MEKLKEKLNRLKSIILDEKSAVIAFSGGVDSTFLLKVASDLLNDKVLAITARSVIYPARELEEAKKLASQMEIEHKFIDLDGLNIPGFSDNSLKRCYICKKEVFSGLKKEAALHGIKTIFDGGNTDDANDFRPGRKALKELGIPSPLEEAGLNKKDIRILSKMHNLTTWDKPSFACLATRFPYHTRITKEALLQVEKAENYLFGLGMKVLRVRHHDLTARIELGENEMRLIFKQGLNKKIARHLKSIGYKYVSLDLEGYRTGSMNEIIDDLQV